LRDGEQTPGVVFNLAAKAQIASALKDIGVDIVEAGSACNGKSEKDSIQRVCEVLGDNKIVSSFARIRDGDVDAVVEAGAGRISLVYPASDCHIAGKLGLKKTDPEFYPKAMAITRKSIEYALGKGLVVELLAEDGSRANPEYLKAVSLMAQEVGVECFCVCDTLGRLMPSRTYELFRYLRDGLDHTLLSFHGHDDKGMSTANTLEALRAGADRFHGTVNGLGERCGNCAMEEVALILLDEYDMRTIDLTRIQALSRLVAGLSNVYPAGSKAVVGEFAFLHDAGIHHAGLQRNMTMYEPYPPDCVGAKHRLSLGKLSGTKTIVGKLNELGIELEEGRIPGLLEAVKRMNEAGAIVSDADFFELVEKVKGNGAHKKVELVQYSGSDGNLVIPFALVKLRMNGDAELKTGFAEGDGPVDAALKAIGQALGASKPELVGYHVDAISGGSNAKVRVNVTVRLGERKIDSSAMDVNIVLASIAAYLKAVNVLL